MTESTTKTIHVSVKPFFNKIFINNKRTEFMFNYTIYIKNLGKEEVKIIGINRITRDSLSPTKNIYDKFDEPNRLILRPNMACEVEYSYAIISSVGYAKGHLIIGNTNNYETENIPLPLVNLIVPFVLN